MYFFDCKRFFTIHALYVFYGYHDFNPSFIKDTLLNVFLERYTHFFMDEEITEYADNYINIDVTFDVTLVKQANR